VKLRSAALIRARLISEKFSARLISARLISATLIRARLIRARLISANLSLDRLSSVAVVVTEVDIGFPIIVGIGSGRSGVREGDVVTTVVITAIASFLVLAGNNVALILVLRLSDGSVVAGNG